MCTAISHHSADHYFGRNLDLEISYNEVVAITPRNFPFLLRNGKTLSTHYAIIGIGAVTNQYPLYFDAVNEKGLALAGLNFPSNAVYYPNNKQKTNITPFELIPYLLGICADITQAKTELQNMNIWAEPFSEAFPLSPLHWMMSDKEESIVIECTADGMRLYENPVGVLTNNPPFPYHLHNLTNYMSLTDEPPVNKQPILLKPYSLGLGGFGLPGDMSSGSRFVKAAFTKMHSRDDATEEGAVNQFFHILGSVCQQRGLTQLNNGKFEFTRYSSCCNTEKGVYYYTTYDNSHITAVDMHREDLNRNDLIIYPLNDRTQILYQN